MNVFFVHAGFFHLFPNHPGVEAYYSALYWHSQAVDLFFMLSGFILFYVYSAGRFTWQQYAMARFARIYPLYLVAWVIYVLLDLILLLRSGYAPAEFNPATVLASLFLVQDWPLLPHFIGINGPTWSISVEVFLYIFLFPVLFKLNEFIADRRKWIFILLPMIGEACFYIFLRPTADDLVGGPFAPFRGILCFTAGFFLCSWGLSKRFSFTIPRAAEIVFLVTMVGCLYSRPLARELILVTFPLLIYLAAQDRSILTWALSGRFFQWLGDISYSVYVWHYPILSAFAAHGIFRKLTLHKLWLSGQEGSGHPSILLSLGFTILEIALVLTVSHFSHYHFEMPVSRWLKRRRQGGGIVS